MRALAPGLGVADIDRAGAGLGESADQGYAQPGLAVDDQHPPVPRIECHLAQLPVVLRVGGGLLGPGGHRRVAGPVDAEREPHACARHAVPGEMGDHRRPGIGSDHAEPPGQAVAEEQIVGMGERGLGQQPAARGQVAPFQPVAEAAPADLARRVLHGRAIGANLEGEPSGGGHGREPVRLARAVARRPGRHAGAPCGVLAGGGWQLRGHGSLRPRIAAEVQRPRS